MNERTSSETLPPLTAANGQHPATQHTKLFDKYNHISIIGAIVEKERHLSDERGELLKNTAALDSRSNARQRSVPTCSRNSNTFDVREVMHVTTSLDDERGDLPQEHCRP